MACPTSSLSMRSFRKSVREGFEEKKITELIVTATEKKAIEKAKYDDVQEDNESEFDVTAEAVANQRHILWIIEVLSQTINNTDCFFENYSVDSLCDVTCFGTVVNEGENDNIMYFLLDDGTAQIIVTYDQSSPFLGFKEEAVKLKDFLKNDSRWKTLEVQALCGIVNNSIDLLEISFPIKQWDTVFVLGHLSQKGDSNVKFIVAQYIIRIDIVTEAVLIQHLGSRYLNKLLNQKRLQNAV